MSNPLLSVRIPPELGALLWQREVERKIRSEVAIAALSAYLKPPGIEDQLAELKQRMELIERQLRQQKLAG